MATQICVKCEVAFPMSAFSKLASGKGYYKTCKKCSGSQKCAYCEKDLPLSSFPMRSDGKTPCKVCTDCKSSDDRGVATVNTADGYKECAKCKTRLLVSEFKPLSTGRGYYKTCNNCASASKDSKTGGEALKVDQVDGDKLVLMASLEEAWSHFYGLCRKGSDAKAYTGAVSKMTAAMKELKPLVVNQ